MDSSKVHGPVPLPPGLHSVQAGAVGAHPITAVSSGSAFPAVAASPSSAAALQAAREAAALRESYLKNEKKQKCATCGNTARARCPYRSCRTCCMKNNKMCYIHGKTELASNGTAMMGTAYERYQAAADMAMVHMSPQCRQPAPPTYLQPGAAGLGRYQSPASGMAYGPQYCRPPFPSTQVPSNWSKVSPGPAQTATHSREELEYMRLKSYRAAAQAMQKEANALSAWRMRKWKEYDEVEAALEDEAFDRYVSSMSWLEELFSVDAPALEGVSADGHLLAGDVEGNAETQTEVPVGEESMLAEGFRMRIATNPRKKELTRQRLKRGIDRNLQKLKTKEENVDLSVEDDDYNLHVLPLGRHAKRLKSTSKEGRDCIKRMDAFDYVLQKVNDIKSRDDIWRCVNLYKDSFGPGIGCVLPQFTQSEDDFLGFAVAKRMKLDNAKQPDWMEIDDSVGAVESSNREVMQDCSLAMNNDVVAGVEQIDARTEELMQEKEDEIRLLPVDKDDLDGVLLEATAADLEIVGGANEQGETDKLEAERAGESMQQADPIVPVEPENRNSGMLPLESTGVSANLCPPESPGVLDHGIVGAPENKLDEVDHVEGSGGDATEARTEATAEHIDDPVVAAESSHVNEVVHDGGVPATDDKAEIEEQQSADVRNPLPPDGNNGAVLLSVEKSDPSAGKAEESIVELEADGCVENQGCSDNLEVVEVEKQGGLNVNLVKELDERSDGAHQNPAESVLSVAPNKDINLKPSVPFETASKATVVEHPQSEVFKVPPAADVAKPLHRRNEDIVQPQNEFPAICVCSWRRVDMPVQIADAVLQELITFDGLEEL